MGPSKLHVREKGGVDFLVFQVFGAFEEFAAIADSLELAKQGAQENGDDHVTIGGRVFKILPHGSGRFQNHAKWMFQHRGITFSVMNRSNSSEGLPVFRVEISSLPLMKLGLRGCRDVVIEVLAAFRCKYWKSKCLRLDVCADVEGLGMEEVYKKWLLGHVIRESRKFAIHGEGPTTNCQTLAIGAAGNPIKLRMYDKVAELQNDPIKREVFYEQRCREGEQCTRVEFQIMREAIRDTFGLDSVEDVLSNLATIVDRLTSQWFRFTESKVDRRHTDRSCIWGWWVAVGEHFSEWVTQLPQKQARRVEREPMMMKKNWRLSEVIWLR